MTTLPRRRRWLWFGGILLLIATLLVGTIGWRYYRNRQRLNEVLARLDREEPGWRLADLQAARQVLSEEENLAPLLLLGPALFPMVPDLAKVNDQLLQLGPLDPLSPDQRTNLQAGVSSQQSALEELRPFRDRGTGRAEYTLSPDLISTRMFHLDGLGGIRTLLRWAILMRLDEGNPGAALDLWYMHCNAARAIGDEPIPISQMVRAGTFLYGIPLLERILASGQLTEQQLAAAQRMLQDEEAWPSLLVAMRGERAFLDAMMEKVQRGEIRLAPIRQMLGAQIQNAPIPRTGNAIADEVLASFKTGSVAVARVEILEQVTQLVAIARLPAEQQGPLIAEVMADLKKKSAFQQELLHLMEMVVKHYPRRQAYLRCALVALAMERYRLQHGRWPERLEQVVPDFLPAVPVDPYDGQPLLYRRHERGVVVYCPGADRKDDQGEILNGMQVKEKDVGFRLFDPEWRLMAGFEKR